VERTEEKGKRVETPDQRPTWNPVYATVSKLWNVLFSIHN